MKKKILVTGADGQVGSELRQRSTSYPFFQFIFTTRKELPLDDAFRLKEGLEQIQPDYIINCAAYTAVDKAESDQSTALAINAHAPALMAAYCESNRVQLLHISTDYVFDGLATTPYKEDDATAPQGVYGATKLDGEQRVMQQHPEAIIIRTAWVYSSFGKNFVKTMKRLMKEKAEIGVVNDQQGSPTYAGDLAGAILTIIASQNWQPGIYHYSNDGICTWFDFAVAIRDLTRSSCKIKAISTGSFPTPAKRPAYSVLDKSKIKSTFQLNIRPWREALEECLQEMKD